MVPVLSQLNKARIGGDKRSLIFLLLQFVLVSLVSLIVLLSMDTVKGLDFTVYREGGQAILRGQYLYGNKLGQPYDSGLPFTYPTFAGLIFTIFSLFSVTTWVVIFTALSYLLFSFMLYDLLVNRGLSELAKLPPLIIIALAICSTVFGQTIGFSQVNVFLMAAIYISTLLDRNQTWVAPSIAAGLTAGIKVTPLVLLLVPLMLWKWRAVLAGGLTFFATIGLSLAILPSQTIKFWSKIIWDPSRIGGVDYVDNYSAKGNIARFNLPGATWLVVVAVAILATAAAIYFLKNRVDNLTLLGLAAGLMLLISPITWCHHAVWFPLIAYSWLRIAQLAGKGLRIYLYTAAAIVSITCVLTTKILLGIFVRNSDAILHSLPLGWKLHAALFALAILVTSIVAAWFGARLASAKTPAVAAE